MRGTTGVGLFILLAFRIFHFALARSPIAECKMQNEKCKMQNGLDGLNPIRGFCASRFPRRTFLVGFGDFLLLVAAGGRAVERFGLADAAGCTKRP